MLTTLFVSVLSLETAYVGQYSGLGVAPNQTPSDYSNARFCGEHPRFNNPFDLSDLWNASRA